jgi:16S rRNA (adenine1518-N6/adenine1519-N6)-dimethyltransferase
MLRALFSARRKTVANGLKAPATAAGTTPTAALARAGLDPRLRPEQLSVDQLVALARALRTL